MPEVLIGDQMSQIDDITLSTIDFGLQGYTGTPSVSRARPKKTNSSKMPKRGKKWPLSYGRGNIHTYFINGEPSSMHWINVSGSGNSDSFFIDGDADEPSTEPRTARLDFDDPPQV
ncbi:hypothetical protein SUGI_0651090 [Cryptomeria japonica]|nr:hypothetical protein SUGI_0651090 [Cryptomeria japonica]